MKGLILNNFYSVEKSIKSSILLTVVIVTFMILSQHSLALRLAAFIPFALIPVHAFEVLKQDSRSGWNRYELTLPLHRHKILLSKYVIFILLFLLGLFITTVIFLLADAFMTITFTQVYVNYLLRGMGLILCIAALTYPLTYLLGTEKSDFIQICSIGFSLGMFGIVFAMLTWIMGKVDGFDEIFSISFFSVAIIFFIISYAISYIIYRKKDY
ncbi:ABC-2 family transporter protein [Oceanobacillus limi]|uniref:ABC-2 family transporter protein n=1 Tax=Oceanobacillus limi TaxID=930131 RepID=A0A1I0EQP2_9BACI|nr:ABC-2 transporter permease [Oceanobacillus limi]SET47821.1 ABC-2 family transporter protein [Oceanobacillus limi]